MAVAAAIVAGLYFVLYHGLLKPRCHAHTLQGPRQPPTIVQGKQLLNNILICAYADPILVSNFNFDFASCHKRL